MKSLARISVMVAVIVAAMSARSQTCVPNSAQTCTPNIGLALPDFQSQGWDVPLNNNALLLDSILRPLAGSATSGPIVFGSNSSPFQPVNSCIVSGVAYVGSGAPYTTCWGSSDIGAQINAAIAVASPGVTISVSAGTYTTTTPINTNNKHITLDCGNWGTHITWTSTGIAIVVNGQDKIRNCWLTVPDAGGSTIIAGGSTVWLANTQFPAGSTISPTIDNANGHQFHTASTCTTANSEPVWPTATANSVTDGGCTWVEFGQQAVTIETNLLEGADAQAVNTGQYEYGWVIRNNTFRNNPPNGEGVLISIGTQQSLIEGNIFQNLGKNAADVDGPRNIIRGNIVNGVASTTVDGSCFTIYSNSASAPTDDVIFENNVCKAPTFSGFHIVAGPGAQHANRMKIIGNQCYQIPTNNACINFGAGPEGELDDGVIAFNTSNGGGYGLFLDVNNGTIIKNTVVSGNTFRNSATSDVLISNGTTSGSVTGTVFTANNFLSGTQFQGSDPTATTMMDGFIKWRADNTWDIGSTTTPFNRPRNVIVGGYVGLGGAPSGTGGQLALGYRSGDAVGDWIGNAGPPQAWPQTVVLHSAYTNATTSFTTLSDGTRNASWLAVANVDYTLSCKIVYQASATTAGPKIQLTGPASPTAVMVSADGGTNATAYADAAATAFSSAITGFGTAGATATNFVLHIAAGISNGANAGTVALQLAANGAGTLTIQPGSYCRWQ